MSLMSAGVKDLLSTSSLSALGGAQVGVPVALMTKSEG